MSPTKAGSSTDQASTAPATKPYRLTKGTHTDWVGDKKSGERVVYSANDPENNTIQLTDEQAKHPAFAGRIESLGQPGQYEMTVATRTVADPGEAEEVQTGAPTSTGTRTLDPNANTQEAKALAEGQAVTTAGSDLSSFSELGWRDAVEKINGMSVADLEKVRTMEEEREKPRTSVLEAIDAREKELAKQQ